MSDPKETLDKMTIVVNVTEISIRQGDIHGSIFGVEVNYPNSGGVWPITLPTLTSVMTFVEGVKAGAKGLPVRMTDVKKIEHEIELEDEFAQAMENGR